MRFLIVFVVSLLALSLVSCGEDVTSSPYSAEDHEGDEPCPPLTCCIDVDLDVDLDAGHDAGDDASKGESAIDTGDGGPAESDGDSDEDGDSGDGDGDEDGDSGDGDGDGDCELGHPAHDDHPGDADGICKNNPDHPLFQKDD